MQQMRLGTSFDVVSKDGDLGVSLEAAGYLWGQNAILVTGAPG